MGRLPSLAKLLANAMVLDVETSGTDPNKFSLISLGAVYKGQEFYVEFVPDKNAWDPKSAAVHGLKLPDLMNQGRKYEFGLNWFYRWMKKTGEFDAFGRYAKTKIPLVFCFPYDMIWMDVYLRRYTKMNPIRNHFRDIRTVMALATGNPFARLPKTAEYTHNALDDARYEMKYLKGLS